MGKARLKISSIDIMGILGLLIWIVTVFLRRYYPINTVIPIFQVMPNFWCAWFATDLWKEDFEYRVLQKSAIFNMCNSYTYGFDK